MQFALSEFLKAMKNLIKTDNLTYTHLHYINQTYHVIHILCRYNVLLKLFYLDIILYGWCPVE